MATRHELAALRPGAAVRIEGDDFMVERTFRFDQADGYAWWEHRLSSAGTGSSRWLEVDPEGPVIVHAGGATLDREPDGAPEIEHHGERFELLMRGRASYRSVERSAAPKSGEVVYYEYASGDRRVTYECRSESTVWEVSEGQVTDPATIEIVA
jgi:hypothetical protein